MRPRDENDSSAESGDSADPVSRLQQSAGNQAVQALAERGALGDGAATGGVVQRQSSGGTPARTGGGSGDSARQRAGELRKETVRGQKSMYGVRVPIVPEMLAALSSDDVRGSVAQQTPDDTSTKQFEGKEKVGGIEATDVTQGKTLGDCYLLAAAAAVAKQRPELVDRLVEPAGDNKYEVTLYTDGGLFQGRSAETVVVDTTFPSVAGQPVYAQQGSGLETNELWPMLIEKAYAKMKGGYGAIDAGDPGEAMNLLTGGSSSETDPREFAKEYGESRLLPMLNQTLANDYFVTLSTFGKGKKSEQLQQDAPVSLNHAYTLVEVDLEKDVVWVRDPYGEQVELTKDQILTYVQTIDTGAASGG